MKKFMLILVVLSMFGCASPVSEPDVEEPIVVTNPFIGTWKSTTGGINSGFTFKDDGTFDYWFALVNTSGSGNYTYTDERLIFSNGKITNINGTFTNINTSHTYEWIDEDQFYLEPNREDRIYPDGRYVRQ